MANLNVCNDYADSDDYADGAGASHRFAAIPGSGSRQDFRNERGPKRPASFATTNKGAITCHHRFTSKACRFATVSQSVQQGDIETRQWIFEGMSGTTSSKKKGRRVILQP